MEDITLFRIISLDQKTRWETFKWLFYNRDLTFTNKIIIKIWKLLVAGRNMMTLFFIVKFCFLVHFLLALSYIFVIFVLFLGWHGTKGYNFTCGMIWCIFSFGNIKKRERGVPSMILYFYLHIGFFLGGKIKHLKYILRSPCILALRVRVILI